MPTPPKPSPQADGTPESLHEAEKKPAAPASAKATADKQRAPRDASDEHLGAKENQVSNTSPPAGQEYTDEPKQG